MPESNYAPLKLARGIWPEALAVSAENAADQAQVAIALVDHLWGDLPIDLRIEAVFKAYDRITEQLASMELEGEIAPQPIYPEEAPS